MANDFERVSQVVDRLSAAGYTDDFRAEADGLRAVKSRCLHPAKEFAVDEIVRFEGNTDPDDAAIVLALCCLPHGVKGTLTTPYGPSLTGVESDVVEELANKRK